MVVFLGSVCIGREDDRVAASESVEDRGLEVGKRKACSGKESDR